MNLMGILILAFVCFIWAGVVVQSLEKEEHDQEVTVLKDKFKDLQELLKRGA